VTTLTVFTPTFNRAHTLPRAYASLERQTSRDFVWLVIDDGSTDNTEALIESWKPVADFEIHYVYQENRGKHAAHNSAVARAESDLLLIMDSDDELLPAAVGQITDAWKSMTAEEKLRIAGIWTLCIDPEGRIIGGSFPCDVFDSSLQELHYRRKISKEMLPTFVTEVLRRHLFPETEPGTCPYIPESYVWMSITRNHQLRFLNVPCRIYHKEEGGLLSMARDEYRLSRCIVYGYLSPLASDLDWFWMRPSWFVFNAVQAARYAMFSRQFCKLAKPLSIAAKALLGAAVPLALLLIAKDALSGRIARQLDRAQELGRQQQ
jgi:glycosyltransferase involved in cell wall biosynthesis